MQNTLFKLNQENKYVSISSWELIIGGQTVYFLTCFNELIDLINTMAQCVVYGVKDKTRAVPVQ